jgi:hypothetical protein
MFKKIVAGVALAGVAFAVFATDARVETMGGTDRFFVDETSIHRNPANMGLFGNIMYGSYGAIAPGVTIWGTVDSSRWHPTQPFFGGVISFGQADDSPKKFTVGATFNRVDSALNLVAFNLDELGLRTVKTGTGAEDNRILLFAGNSFSNAWNRQRDIELAGKLDLMFSKTLPNGTTIGLGTYLAFQDGSMRHLIGGEVPEAMLRVANVSDLKNRFIKGNIGVNTPIGDGVDLDASIGISTLMLAGTLNTAAPVGVSQFHRAADNDVGIHVDVRMFADVPAMNGAFVPSLRADIVNYGDDERLVNFSAGLGINVNIDRGFFWTGFYGLYNKKSYALIDDKDISARDGGRLFIPATAFGAKDMMGGKVGFGIERNVLTDWFILRVGGAKMLAKETFGENQGSRWVETNDVDHVSLGMGVNVENRLKIDFTIAQNLPYTFTNMFSDSRNPYLASRVSAVFAF